MFGHCAGLIKEAIDESRFTVVDVRDDRDISNVRAFHEFLSGANMIDGTSSLRMTAVHTF
jgi:hypothetical protein